MCARRSAIYAGSFDPTTVGHLDVIERGAALYDRLVVAVGLNPVKRYWFPLDERVALLTQATEHIHNIQIVSFHGLLVDAAREHEAGVILRGLRALADFDQEFRYGLANRDLSGLETLFMLTDPEHVFVSSSIVKEIATNGGDVTRYVPPCVARAIADRLRAEEPPPAR